MRMRRGCGLGNCTRGALTDAPRRDTTMTQNSDSGDAVGDAGPTTDGADDGAQGKNRLNRMEAPGIDWASKYCRAAIRTVDWRQFEPSSPEMPADGGYACAGMISVAATTSRTIAAAAAAWRRRRRLPIGGGGLGIGTIVVLGLIGWALGIDPRIADRRRRNPHRRRQPQLRTARAAAASRNGARRATQTGQFVAAVLGDTEDPWKEIFAEQRQTYEPPRLGLFSRRRPTPCAFAQSAMGPFYCPRDQHIYLDTSFFRDLQTQVPRLHRRQGLRVRRRPT